MNAKKELAKLKELHELSKPLIDYMRKNFNPHDIIVITNFNVTLYTSGLSVPADFDNWEFDQNRVSSCGYPATWEIDSLQGND